MLGILTGGLAILLLEILTGEQAIKLTMYIVVRSFPLGSRMAIKKHFKLT